jgi:hypothetical protein
LSSCPRRFAINSGLCRMFIYRFIPENAEV